MRMRLESALFSETVSWVAKTIQPNPAKAILGGLLIDANEDGTVVLSSNDPSLAARAVIEASVEEPGKCVVNGKLLAAYAGSLPKKKPLSVVAEETRMTLTCANAEMTVGLLPLEDYPEAVELPDFAGTVDGTDWNEAVVNVSASASKDDSLPLLTSICIRIEGTKLTLMATDRYRLSVKELEWEPVDPALETTVLVRASKIADISKSLTCEGPVELHIGDDSRIIGLKAGTMQNTVQKTQGDYPDVLGLFPEDSPITAILERAALQEALKRASFVVEKNAAVRLNFSEGQLEVAAGQGEIAAFSEILECSLSGGDINSAFNPNYLQEALAKMKSPFVRFAFTQATKPAVITQLDKEDGDIDPTYRILQMPIRLYD